MDAFVIDWRKGRRSLISLADTLEKPAGAKGPIRIRNGRFHAPSGRRFRIWGVNLTGAACYPAPRDAAMAADTLARLGINCVRFHFLDSNWGKGASIFPPNGETTRHLDKGQLARLDRFFFELKQRGIYGNFNLNVGRVYRAQDGVADHEYIGMAKVLQYFDQRIADLHCEYATQLLTHRNPYTGRQYRYEPALMLVELVNENSLIEAWFSGRLRGRHADKRTGTWADTTPHYAGLLTRLFNEHIARIYPAPMVRRWREAAGANPDGLLTLLEPEQFSAAEYSRFSAEARFYMELERAYFARMKKLLRKLGVRAPLIATSDHNHAHTGYPLVASASELDVVDGHIYWEHPEYLGGEGGRRRDSWIRNSPMVRSPRNSTPVQLARTAVAGKPYTVSEVNHPFPAERACEGIPILSAYALLQDWDGIFWYTFDHAAPADWEKRAIGHFDLRPDPMKLAQIAACGLMFRRGDLKRAKRTVFRSYSKRQVIEGIRTPVDPASFFTPGWLPALPLVHATRIRSFRKAGRSCPSAGRGTAIVSDTGQIRWSRRGRRGWVAAAGERVAVLAGHLGRRKVNAGALAARLKTGFSAVVLTSLDGKPLENSERMLLTAGARAATTGMKWREGRHRLMNWGRRPMRIERVKGQLALRRSRSAPPLEIVALDGAGRALGPGRAARKLNGKVELALGRPTVWYLLYVPGRGGKNAV